MDEQDLIHDWNRAPSAHDWSKTTRVELDDETLRDGLQNPSVVGTGRWLGCGYYNFMESDTLSESRIP